MTEALEAVVAAFSRAYRNAGGRGDPSSLVRTGRAPASNRVSHDEVVCRRLHPDEARSGSIILSQDGLNRTGRDGRRTLPRTDLRMIGLTTASLARAERRRAAIAAVGDERDPLWSLTAHPVLAATLKLYEIDVADLMATAERLDIAGHPHTISVSEGEYEAGFRIIAGHVWAHRFLERRTSMRLMQGHERIHCRIMVEGMEMPQTVLLAMKGRPLCQALDHPLVDLLPDMRIRQLTNSRAPGASSPGVGIDMRARAVPLAEAPAGVDVSWRKLPTLHYGDLV